MTIARTILHTVSQAGVGVLAGSIVDAVFPAVGKTDAKTTQQRAIILAEIVAQLVANGLLTAGFYRMLRRLGQEGAGDPTGGMAYAFMSFESQPMLKKKVGLIAGAIRGAVHDVESELHLRTAGGQAALQDKRLGRGTGSNSAPQ